MKKVLLAIVITASFAACNNKADTPLKTDVVVLSPNNNNDNFSSALSDTSLTEEVVNPLREDDHERNVSYTPKRKTSPAINRQRPVRPVPNQAPVKETATVPAPAPVPATNDNTNTGTNTGAGNTNTGTDDNGTVSTTTDTTASVKKEKKGWSNATKGAVIGGVGGAIGGAILSKKKGKGAIIGGVIGAAGGYIFGKTKDNKEAKENNFYPQYK